MRKTNVFGKKINPSRPLYWLIFVFIIAMGSYFALYYISNMKISDLQLQQSEIQQNINQLLIEEQNEDYYDIEELMPYLPNDYTESIIYNELILVRDLAGLDEANNYSATFNDEASSPFSFALSNSLNYVKITINMNIADYENFFDYMDYLIHMDRIYYVESFDLNILTNDNAMCEIVIYTFYISQ